MTVKKPVKKKEEIAKDVKVSPEDTVKSAFHAELKIDDPEQNLRVLNELADGYLWLDGKSRKKVVQRVWNGWKHLLSDKVYEPDPEWGTKEGNARDAKAFRLVEKEKSV